MGEIIPLYDVVIQAFIDPSDYNGGVITDNEQVKNTREGVLGSKGLKKICQENNVQLAISMGGGGAARFIPNDPSDFGALIDALYNYVTEHGYSGIDVDEENTVDVGTYVAFMQQLGAKFRPSNLTVSCTVGPLSCCYESRGICALKGHVDWVFLMLYDGLTNSAAFDTQTGTFLWQDTDGQKFCNITTNSTSQFGIVGNVLTGACQFINFGLYLNWPAELLIMGIPSYSYPAPKAWFQFEEQQVSPVERDATQALTKFSDGNWIPTGEDVADRTSWVLDSAQSRLGVTLYNHGWQSRIIQCQASGLYAGATLQGVGFWALGMEDPKHHELSTAARKVIDAINFK
eukprot:TRINITY_DN3322_c0_g1_i2.p1 TRINITY_DN3322_c0_g1~~TRINITY_DN3322_c0_g1_i2.p1  ORF type:complete len:400 (+),score=100.80 TRINITY_DN3322_c0_g1_i2:167-1201(+)